MDIKDPEIGICGLSCRLCPTFNSDAKSKCYGCKSEYRMRAGCPFITCAIKKREIEFCWACEESDSCKKWQQHRDYSRQFDSFKCYQSLEQDILFIDKNGVDLFENIQIRRHQLLKEMLENYNEGRSKSYYCIAVSVFEIDDLQKALHQANVESNGLQIKEKSKILHSILDSLALDKRKRLKLRK